MEKLEDKQVLVEFLKRRDGRVAERAVRFLDQFSQIVARDLVFRDVKGKDLNGEVDKRIGFPFLLPIRGEGRDVFWDVQPSIWCKSGEDGLDRWSKVSAAQECERKPTDIFEREPFRTTSG